MAKVCEVCGKGYLKGHKVSFSAKKSIRRFKPNLFNRKVEVEGKTQRVVMCAACLKRIKAATPDTRS